MDDLRVPIWLIRLPIGFGAERATRRPEGANADRFGMRQGWPVDAGAGLALSAGHRQFKVTWNS